MADNNNTVSKTINDIEYTVVLDRRMISTEALDSKADNQKNLKEDIDLLYREYEKMRLMEPTVLDIDDIYPRSYQWRMGDRYDMGKVAALEEALKNRKSIEETEAYSKYIETVSRSGMSPDAWK